MPDFQHVPAPVFSPTMCVTCSTSKHPDGFVDLLVENAVNGYDEEGNPVLAEDRQAFGHLTICAACVKQAAARVGCLAPEDADQLRHELDLARDYVAVKEAELQAALADKVVRVQDLQGYFDRPAEPAKAKAPARA